MSEVEQTVVEPVSEVPADLTIPTEVTPAEEPEDGSINWDHISQEMELHDEDLTIPTPDILETPPPEEPVAAEAAPTPLPVVEPPAPVVEEPAAETPPVAEPVTPEPQAVEPQLPTPEPTQPEAVLPVQPEVQGPTPEQTAQLRTDYLNQVSQMYQLNQEQAGQMVTDPNAVLPQLAATLHVNILEQSLQANREMIQRMLPDYLGNFLTQREDTTSATEEFFSQWEELRPQKDRVMQLATVYRQTNPQATKEQFFRDVGMQSWMALGMDTGQLAAKLAPQQPAPAAPAAPAAPQVPTGLLPANPGSSTPLPSSQPGNPFADLAEEFSREDADDF